MRRQKRNFGWYFLMYLHSAKTCSGWLLLLLLSLKFHKAGGIFLHSFPHKRLQQNLDRPLFCRLDYSQLYWQFSDNQSGKQNPWHHSLLAKCCLYHIGDLEWDQQTKAKLVGAVLASCWSFCWWNRTVKEWLELFNLSSTAADNNLWGAYPRPVTKVESKEKKK